MQIESTLLARRQNTVDVRKSTLIQCGNNVSWSSWINVCKITLMQRPYYVVATFFRPNYNVEIMSCARWVLISFNFISGGYLANSLAIITDAAHLLSDFASFLISLLAIWFATRPSTPTLSYGWHRAGAGYILLHYTESTRTNFVPRAFSWLSASWRKPWSALFNTGFWLAAFYWARFCVICCT